MSGLGTSTHHCSLQLSCFYCNIYLYFLTQTKHQKHLYKLDVYSNTSTYDFILHFNYFTDFLNSGTVT